MKINFPQLDGLDLFPDFMATPRETTIAELCSYRASDALMPSRHTNKGAERYRLERYGKSAGYPDGIVSSRIPAHLDDLATELVQRQIMATKSNAITINEYRSGNGLRPHVDKPEGGDEICILGLLADAEMFFELEGSPSHVVKFPRRAVLRMRGPARWAWSHGILPAKQRRISIVFRVQAIPVGVDPTP